MMTSAQIRQSFLDFFKSKQHTLVPSSSLMPDAPNLLFTNAGMNQFVPIFLGERKADVTRWANSVPSLDTRAADTQKCIRAGGKHNDLEDVGLDTYHHTFFEMLGNWSFGDYFKKEAIEWAWELITSEKWWGFPKERLYATVYKPGEGDPAAFDQEAYDIWAGIFQQAGLDPKVHIVFGNKKDNFWMMGDTGPCGPCSEIHVDLTPNGDTGGSLVNKGDARCIEIWNLVFIQFNANPDGTFSPLPAKHVDTGMGFERVTSIMQCTKGLTDFAARISNYETDIFRPIFDAIEKLSGKQYGSTLPKAGSAGDTEQEKIDVAFRVIADHIRTLSFAIADGIQPGNNDRNYVLRRILRRAVRYGRTLGFHKPFFYELVDVLAETMGDVFPEIRARKAHVKEVIRVEEEAFNKTLDRGIELFNEEVAKLGVMGSAPASGAADRALAVGSGASESQGAVYSKRRLPHFERPWSKYMVTFSTRQKRALTPAERDVVLESVLYSHNHRQYQLFAACVMPDHVHLLFEPQIKEEDAEGKPVFWSLGEILGGIKSTTAHRINKAAKVTGVHVWEAESFDRLIRGDADLEEKFHYICRNPWDNAVVSPTENYRWLWTPDAPVAGDRSGVSREGAGNSARGGRGPLLIPGEFAFKLYDTYGFPLDLTELMARERGLTVDVAGFNVLMEEQRERARAAQKKTVISITDLPHVETQFVGYEQLESECRVLSTFVEMNRDGSDSLFAVVDVCPLYAEMGGQVGDQGSLFIEKEGQVYRIKDTIKRGKAFFLNLESTDEEPWLPNEAPAARLVVDRSRRRAIERHHTVTHIFHWALHEVVNRDATQKGSYVGPEKLTFDFNCAPLTPQQLADIEKLVNERILENAVVNWTEVPYTDVRSRADVMQLFGEKYGDTVRVVQIGGGAGDLNGYSMELCGGTHTRHTGEIGLFRLVSESAIAAGVRRVEAIAGLEAWRRAGDELELLKRVSGRVNSPLNELEKKIEAMLAHQKELEKALKAANQREAAQSAKSLVAVAETIKGVQVIAKNMGEADGDTLQTVADALKGEFKGIVVLGGLSDGAVALVATVSPELTKQFQAGKIIQAIAPIVGGKGGGRPDNARGGGKDAGKLEEALAKAKSLLA